MQDEPGGRRPVQFSLGKLVFWFLLVSSMIGVVVAAYKQSDEYRRTSARTRHQLHIVSVALMNYRQEWGVYPGWEAAGAPPVLKNTYNLSSIVKGERDDGPLNTVSLMEFLVSEKYISRSLYESYPDRWGRPMVVRFLRVPETQSDGSMKVVERFYVWSYGEDGVNGVDATPDYKNQGAPDYDKEEFERIEKSLKDCGDDIVITDR